MAAIEVDGLKKDYGTLHAVDGLSFEVSEGEVFSLLGPNGAGKTTTIEILEGLRERTHGEVRVLGKDPWTNGYELHQKIGVIPQGFKFLDYPTPREAINYYAALFGKKVDPDELLRKVVLEERASKTYFMQLSGGQKQKLGMALALVNDPQLVFLDEPTTGLDPQARRATWEVIRKLKAEGRTVLLTTHYLEEAEELADRVAIVSHGKILALGTPSEIITKHGSGERLTVSAKGDLADYLKRNTKLRVDFDGNNLVSVYLEKKSDAVVALGAIQDSGLDWDNLSTRRDSLEDVFLDMVGEEARAEQGVGRETV